MRIDKPKIQRVYVRVTDAETGKTENRTFYNATISDIFRRIIGKSMDGKSEQRQLKNG